MRRSFVLRCPSAIMFSVVRSRFKISVVDGNLIVHLDFWLSFGKCFRFRFCFGDWGVNCFYFYSSNFFSGSKVVYPTIFFLVTAL